MKHQVLYVPTLPNFYKHCSSVMFLHINFKDGGITNHQAFANAYLAYVKEQIYTAVEANFVTSLASKVKSHHETFIIFKSNTNKKLLIDFIEAMFAELDLYTQKKVTITYQYMEAMLFKEGSPVKLFKSSKLGDDIQSSDIYQKQAILYTHNKKPRGKQFLSLAEYEPLYQKMEKTKHVQPVQDRNAYKTQDAVEECCEYYI